MRHNQLAFATVLLLCSGGVTATPSQVRGGVTIASRAIDDKPVKLEECPKPVQATILERVKGGKINEIEMDGEGPSATYEVEAVIDGNVRDFIVAADGKFVGFEDDEPAGAGEPDDDEGEDGEEDGEGEGAEGPAGAGGAGAVAIPTPIKDGATFSATVDHPFFPLSLVRYAELEDEDGDKMVREVQEKTKVIAGVECLVLAEKEYEDGVLFEISYNYFAQDRSGNVYYFGEDVDDYKDGKVVGHGGAWLVGKNAAEPCLIMPARPRVGLEFKPENSAPDAEEWDRVERLDAELEVPAGDYEGVLVIAEGDQRGKWKERKYYARGVGLISENKTLNLTLVRIKAK